MSARAALCQEGSPVPQVRHVRVPQESLEAFAISLPFFVALDDTRRSALIVGIVYPVIYVLTSYASRGAANLGRRPEGLARAVNATPWRGRSRCYWLALQPAGNGTRWPLRSF